VGDALYNPAFRPDVLSDNQTVGSVGAVDPVNGTQYLNPEAFGAPPSTANGVPERLGNAPRHLPSTRSFAVYSEDVSLIKRTDLPFREGMNLEIRFDFTNIFNRTRNNGPDTDLSSSDFGKFFGKGGAPRNIQAGLRITF
jgi:hypothetical protein